MTGTAKQEVVLSGTSAKIITSPVTNKYIYEQFGVNFADYALVEDVDSSVLALLPRSVLPVI